MAFRAKIDFEKHNEEVMKTVDQRHRPPLVIPLAFAEQLVKLGDWDRYKADVVIDFPLSKS